MAPSLVRRRSSAGNYHPPSRPPKLNEREEAMEGTVKGNESTASGFPIARFAGAQIITDNKKAITPLHDLPEGPASVGATAA